MGALMTSKKLKKQFSCTCKASVQSLDYNHYTYLTNVGREYTHFSNFHKYFSDKNYVKILFGNKNDFYLGCICIKPMQ